MLAHTVFFTLHDQSPAACARLVEACKEYLSGEPGIVFFACGQLAADMDRPVNDRAFQVGLHIVFDTRAAHDRYQEAPRHNQFLAENSANWQQLRVFDINVEA